MPTQLSPAFHDVRFPTDIAFGSSGGPQRRTEIVSLGSGHEQRNARWSASRRRFDAGYGVKTLNDLHTIIAFYEARRGPLYGFRFRDQLDWKSGDPLDQISATDQVIGTGDGTQTAFQLVKHYGEAAAYTRIINKPVAGSVLLAIDGVPLAETVDYTLDDAGLVSLNTAPDAGALVSAGFLFDVPVRFESDQLTVNIAAFNAGEIPSIPLLEIRL